MRVTSALQTLAPEVRKHSITGSNQSTEAQVHCPGRCLTGHGVEDIKDAACRRATSTTQHLLHLCFSGKLIGAPECAILRYCKLRVRCQNIFCCVHRAQVNAPSAVRVMLIPIYSDTRVCLEYPCGGSHCTDTEV